MVIILFRNKIEVIEGKQPSLHRSALWKFPHSKHKNLVFLSTRRFGAYFIWINALLFFKKLSTCLPSCPQTPGWASPSARFEIAASLSCAVCVRVGRASLVLRCGLPEPPLTPLRSHINPGSRCLASTLGPAAGLTPRSREDLSAWFVTAQEGPACPPAPARWSWGSVPHRPRGFEPRELPAGLSLGGTPELSYLSAVPSSAQLPAPPSSTRLWSLPLKNALLLSGPSPPPFHSLHLIFEDSTPGSVPLWSYEGLGYRAVVFQLCFPVSKERDTFLPIKGRGWMCPLASSHTHPWLAGRLFLPIVGVVHKCVLRTRIEKSKCQNLGFTYLTKTNDRFQTRLFFEYLFPCS